MTNIKLRISILNAPDDLSPLKLRGWLMQQAKDIQEISGENGYVQIKLFLTRRQRFAFTQKKLDTLLQGIVDKFPAIHRIELGEVETSLSNEQMRDAAEQAELDLQALSASLDNYLSKKTDTKPH